MEENRASPESDRLTEAAVRTLEDNPEIRLAACRFLESVRPPGVGGEEILIRRWQQVDARRRKSMGCWWLGFGVVLISVMAAWFSRGTLRVALDQAGMLASPFAEREGAQRRTAARMEEGDRFLVFGNDPIAGSVEGRKAVWNAQPEDPVRYAAYVAACLKEFEQMPEDYRETARRMDPTNSWFLYLDASIQGRDSVKRIRGEWIGKRGSGKREPDTWTIVDEEKFRTATGLLRQATGLPDFRNHRLEIQRSLLQVLPLDSFASQIDSSACLASFSLSDIIRLRGIADLISAMAYEAAEKGDRMEMGRVMQDAEVFLRGIVMSECSTALEGLVNQLLITQISESLGIQAARLGMEAEGKRWNAVFARISARQEEVKNRRFQVDGKTQSTRVCGMFCGDAAASLSIRVDEPPPLSDRDLRPGRWIDHGMVAIGCSVIGWVSSGLALLGFFFYQFRTSLMIRRLSRRMISLFTVGDWAWILAGGLIGPMIWVGAVAILTPLGGQSFGWLGNFMLLPTCHFLAILLAWWMAPRVLARMRLARRAGSLGFKGPAIWDWAGIACLVAFVPAMGAGVVFGVPDSALLNWLEEEVYLSVGAVSGSSLGFRVAVALCGVAVVELTIRGFMAVVGMGRNPLAAAVVARVMVPVCAVAMALSALGVMVFDAAVDHAFRQDQPFKLDARYPAWTPYEYDVANRMKGELQEILGFSE